MCSSGTPGHSRSDRGEELVAEADEEALEDQLRLRAPLLAGHQDLGRRRAFRVGQPAVLLHDQVAAQRDHHQDAQDAAAEREQQRARPVHLEAEQHERGQGERHARRDRLPRGAGGLHDGVLEDRGAPARQDPRERAEDRDGEDGDGDGGGDGEADAQRQVDGRGAEDEPEDRAQDERARRQLGKPGLVRNVGLEGRRRRAG